MGKTIVGGLIVIAVIAFFVMRGNNEESSSVQQDKNSQSETMSDFDQSDVKEFAMTSYYDEQGKWFSLKEINVKKGDKVRIKVTNTKGMHDFTLDEYGIKKETPLNEETVIEFIADKAGDFVYYCSKPGHRAGGQWGTLKVSE